MPNTPDGAAAPHAAGTGSLLRRYRQRALLTQEDLAARTGISARTIRRLESHELRRPRMATLRALAGALRLTSAEQAALLASQAGSAPGGPNPPGMAAPGVPPAAARGVDPAASAVYRFAVAQLPADVPTFTGRANHLARLDAVLASAAQDPEDVTLAAITGTAGCGKTALAIKWAHRIADRFPDGQLHADLGGFEVAGRALEPAVAIRGFLEALEVPPRRIPRSLGAQAALYRSLLAGRRMLIVLDNARDTAQIRPLLPGAAGSLVLVTSRNPLTGLIARHGAHPVALDLLPPDEARSLLIRRLGAERIVAEPEAVRDIVTRCVGLPLALVMVAAHAALAPRASLRSLADELVDVHRRWQVLASDEPATDLHTVYSWSYRSLTPDAARLFRRLGRHPDQQVSIATAAGLVGIPREAVAPLLTELTRTGMLAEPQPGQYALHDLLSAYARQLPAVASPQHPAPLGHRPVAARRSLHSQSRTYGKDVGAARGRG